MTARSYTHLYDRYDDARATFQALEAAGIAHADISLVAHRGPGDGADTAEEPSVGGAAAGVGGGLGAMAGLAAGLGLLAIPGVGVVVAAGWLVATLAGAGVGAAAGGLLGSLLGAGVPEDQAHVYAEGVRRGGALITVRADDSQAGAIEAVLEGRAGSAVDVARRRAEYHAQDWRGHVADGGALSQAEIAEERARRGV